MSINHSFLVGLVCFSLCAHSQTIALHNANQTTTAITKQDKPKPIRYNAIGALIPLNKEDIIVGGTSISFKRIGTFVNYKVGVQNWLMPKNGTLGDFNKKNVQQNGWTITANRQEAVTFMLGGGLSFALFKKAPFYIGAGFTRYRPFFEYIDPFDNKPKWNVDTENVRFELNYTAGMFIPILGRLILNVGYDHNPQSVFVGLALRGIYAYEDIDEWK